MVTPLQERRIAEAQEALQKRARDRGVDGDVVVTAGQIWKYLSSEYKNPGFKSAKAVGHVLGILKRRNRQL